MKVMNVGSTLYAFCITGMRDAREGEGRRRGEAERGGGEGRRRGEAERGGGEGRRRGGDEINENL